VFGRTFGILLLLLSFSVQALEPELLIFISFGMPEKSLKLWAKQINRVGGKLLLRGFFENSLQETATKTLAIFGAEPNVDIAIDPERFQQFKVEVVPAVVVVKRQETLENNDVLPDFDVVYGDTTLEAALERISQSGSMEGQRAANAFLKRYREAHD